VGHACNPSYSGDRDQEDYSLKLAQTSSVQTLSQKYPTKKGLVGWLKCKAPA
jgi:hypothetical protein